MRARQLHGTLAVLIVFCAAATSRAETAADTADQPPVALGGFLPDKTFVLESADKSYKLRIGLQAAYRIEPRYLDGTSQNRDAIFSTRPILAGNLVRHWITFLVSTELANNPPFLLYSYIDFRPWKAFGLRAGQQDTPFSRHENFGLYRIIFPETGPVADYFWSGRDKGVMAYGSVANDRVDYYAGYFGGSPLRQFTTIAGNYVAEGRLTFNPMGKVGDAEFAYALGDSPVPTRISFTIQGYLGHVQSAAENFDPNSFLYNATATGMTTRERAGGADFFLQSSRVMFTTEGYIRRTYPDGSASYLSMGAWGQVGVLLLRQLDAAVQVDWANASTALSSDRLLGGEAQVTYYLSAPTLILKLRYAYFEQQTPGTTALGAVTLPATAGRTQLGTLQVNLAF